MIDPTLFSDNINAAFVERFVDEISAAAFEDVDEDDFIYLPSIGYSPCGEDSDYCEEGCDDTCCPYNSGYEEEEE